jgi:hypothetical protein
MAENDIMIDCPVCEESVQIATREIKLAIQHKKDTDGKILITCPACCRALEVPPEIPQNGAELTEWLGEMAENPDDWCGCVPMLDMNQERRPAGGYADLNIWYYQPGGGGKPLPKRKYMLTYGINPQCYMAKNPDMGGKPTKLGTPVKK